MIQRRCKTHNAVELAEAFFKISEAQIDSRFRKYSVVVTHRDLFRSEVMIVSVSIYEVNVIKSDFRNSVSTWFNVNCGSG